MESNKRGSLKNRVLGIFLTIVVIGILLMIRPAEAVTVKLSETDYNNGVYVYTTSVDIHSDDFLRMDFLAVRITNIDTDAVSTCYFNVTNSSIDYIYSQNNANACDAITIQNIVNNGASNTGVNSGTAYGFGYGIGNASMGKSNVTWTSVPVGYGFNYTSGVGYDSFTDTTSGNGEIQFVFTFDTNKAGLPKGYWYSLRAGVAGLQSGQIRYTYYNSADSYPIEAKGQSGDDYMSPGNANCGGNATISGWVLYTNSSAASSYGQAEVMLYPDMDQSTDQNQTPDCWGFSEINGSGFYEITNVSSGDYYVQFEARGTNFANSEYQLSGLQNSTNYSVNFTLVPGGMITGIAYANASTSDSDQSAENTTFNGGADAYSDYAGFGGWTDISSTGSGEFNISGVPAGTFEVHVKSWDNQYAESTTTDVVVAAGTTTNITADSGIIWLSQGQMMNGTIKDDNNNTIQGVFLDMFNEETFTFSWAESDSNGAYTAYGLTQGPTYIRVNPPYGTNYGSAEKLIEITSDDDIERNFTLRTGVFINGTITKASDDSALVNVDVMAFPISMGPSDSATASGFTFTDSNGGYQINGLQTNTKYQVEVETQWNPAYSSLGLQRGIATVDLGSNSSEQNFSLSTGKWIAGRIVDGQGNAVSRASVNAWIPPTDQYSAPTAFGFDETDTNGDYNITGLPNGDYEMYAEPPYNNANLATASKMGDNAVTVAGSGVNETNFTLNSGGRVIGRLVDSSTGVGISGVSIDVWKDGAGWAGGKSNLEGYFTVKGLATGTDYHLEVHPFGTEYTNYEEKVNVVSGQTTDVGNISLSTGVDMYGYIFNDGSAVSSANIDVWSPNARGWGFDQTGANGYYNISGLPNGTYNVFVWLSSGEEMFRRVNVSSTGLYRNFSFGSGSGVGFGNLTVNVTNGAGSGIQNAKVDVFNPSLFQGGYGATSADGEVNITDLMAGAGYEFGAFKPGYYFNFTNSSMTIVNSTNHVWNLTLYAIGGSLYDLNGTVSGNNNRTVLMLAVENSSTNPATYANSTTGDDKDTYVIHDIPEGYYNVKGVKGTSIENYTSNPVNLNADKEINLSFS